MLHFSKIVFILNVEKKLHTMQQDVHLQVPAKLKRFQTVWLKIQQRGLLTAIIC